jgi:hypothetical protein
MTETACRTAIRLILKDLSSKSLRLSGQQRYKLHTRVEQLQEELRVLEIEKLERELVCATTTETTRK